MPISLSVSKRSLSAILIFVALASLLTGGATRATDARAATGAGCASIGGRADGVLVIGDSLTVYSAAQLRRTLSAQGFRVCLDGLGGRNTAEGVATLGGYARRHQLPRTIVMALSTNDVRTARPSFRASVRETLRIAGSRDMLWVSGYRSRDPRAMTALRRLDRDLAAIDARSGQLRWANWAARAQGHPGYYQKDGLHLTASGNNARIGFIAKGLRLMRG